MYTKKTSLDIEKTERNSTTYFPFFSHMQPNLESEVNAVILYILHLPLYICGDTYIQGVRSWNTKKLFQCCRSRHFVIVQIRLF